MLDLFLLILRLRDFWLVFRFLGVWSVPLSVWVSPLTVLVIKDRRSVLRMNILWHLESLWIERLLAAALTILCSSAILAL